MKILITGAQGMLGQDLVKVFELAEHEVIIASRQDLDITNAQDVDEFILNVNPDVVINAAAYNDVDAIEQDEGFVRALQINADGPGYLSKASKKCGAKFVHFSTDYVFDGDEQKFYSEDDQVKSISRYGDSKLKGEELSLKFGEDVYICRVSKLFGVSGNGESSKENVVSLMLRLNKEIEDLKIVDEEYGCPTYSPDVARAVLQLVEDGFESGIYHFINEGDPVSVYGFAKEIFDTVGITENFRPVPRSEFPRPAKCPQFAPLKNTKFPKLRQRKEALSEFLEKLKKV